MRWICLKQFKGIQNLIFFFLNLKYLFFFLFTKNIKNFSFNLNNIYCTFKFMKHLLSNLK